MTSRTAEILAFTKPEASFVDVTPEVAEGWLARNVKNRKIIKPALARYKRDMLAGRWHLAGDPIRFAPDGTVLDGQHRLQAIVETGITLPLLVVRNIEKTAQSVMDTGRKRTSADALAIDGHRFPIMEAAVARLIIETEAGAVDYRPGAGGRMEISHDEVIACLETNSDTVSAIEFTAPLARLTDCPPAVVAYTYMVMRRIDPTDAAEFWVGMAEKVGLYKGDPILVLSKRLAEAKRGREVLSRRILLSMIYRCWNARRRGESMQFIRITSDKSKGRIVPIPDPR